MTAAPAVAAASSAAASTSGNDEFLKELVARFGESQRHRLERGIRQVNDAWTPADGSEQEKLDFIVSHFVPEGGDLERLRQRLETALEQISGHLYEMRRTLRRWSDLRGDDMPGIDDILAMFDPAPDLSEQVYQQRLAFLALLNFPKRDLGTMLAQGGKWTVSDWVEARIVQSFGPRIPKALSDKARAVGHRANQFVNGFHVPVEAVVADGKRWLPAGRALIAHWLIREEVKAQYGDAPAIALPRQRALMHVMRHHIEGTVPVAVMDGTDTSNWDPAANSLGGEAVAGSACFGLARYERWLEQFHLAREFDRHHPDHPTAIARKFELAREVPESEVEALLVSLLEHPVRRELASFLARKIGRPLESFDVYFEDFAEARPAAEMNAAVTARFPDEKSFQAALPAVLRGLGWSADDADFLGSRVQVEICKGAGHAMRPAMGQFGAWLRTSRLPECLGWDGFDTAMHELGHNLEQLCSCYYAPSPALRGVPNTACTEAFAFLYQSLGRRVLGLATSDDEQRDFDLEAVNTLQATAQIAGPGLMELHVWRWLYTHPDANADALRAEVLRLADEIWARYFARDFGPDPYRLSAAYQHMIAHPLYLPDYALGHIISHQIRSHMRGRDLATETKRITSQGRLTPDVWMRGAVGAPISVMALCDDAARALGRLA
ncbi:MAG: hypothetical protein O2855_01370 [Planctomycetota bacterium]|nr:hypothetical protein [Planctomycetota bacterium]